jgi:ABC-2 type transport system ATP-binding protein
VFVSSHLMNEMAVTADHVIVIGRGKLLRDEGVNEFVDSVSEQWVLVRSPQLDALSDELIKAGARVKPGLEDSIEIAGLDARSIGDLAAAKGLTLHELATQRGSLEDAFMDLTRDSVEFRAGKDAA